MSELREAAQAAVDAFNEHGYSPLTVKAIWALRDALAEDRLAEPAKGEAKIRIPTATMEQEFSNYHRIGYKAGATAEREACAQVCESEGQRIDAGWSSCAAAIRARGEK